MGEGSRRAAFVLDRLRSLAFSAAAVIALAALAMGCSGKKLPGMTVNMTCACFTDCTATTGLGTRPASTCVENSATPADITSAARSACTDAETKCIIGTCVPYFSHLDCCTPAFIPPPGPPACMTNSPVTLGFRDAIATVATIDPSRSEGHLIFGGDAGAFTPVGTITLGGGFCVDSSCPGIIEDIQVQASDAFAVGTHTVDSLTVIANGPFPVQISGGTVNVPGSPLLAATVMVDGHGPFSQASAPDLLTGTLDNVARELTLTGTLATSDGTASFTVVATLGDSPPVAVFDGPDVGECGVPVTLSGARSFDPDREKLVKYEWFEQARSLGTGQTLNVAFPVGDHQLGLFVTDASGRKGVDSKVLHVFDTVAPKVVQVTATPACLWPPNHELIHYALGTDVLVQVSDACDPSPHVEFTGGTSNEAENGLGDGNTTGDIRVGSSAFCVRSERSGTVREPRTYTVGIKVVNANNLTSTSSVTVQVPHDQRGGSKCGAAPTSREFSDTAPECVFSPSLPASYPPAPTKELRGGCNSVPAEPGVLLIGLAAMLRRRRK